MSPWPEGQKPTLNWSGRQDLNLRPPAPKAGYMPVLWIRESPCEAVTCSFVQNGPISPKKYSRILGMDSGMDHATVTETPLLNAESCSSRDLIESLLESWNGIVAVTEMPGLTWAISDDDPPGR
jgi:hypothetical protein